MVHKLKQKFLVGRVSKELKKSGQMQNNFPSVLAGLYRRVRGRLLHVAGLLPDAQQALKELART